MERIVGSTWLQVVDKFDMNFYVRFARLLEAVRALHEKGFVHFDLKPSNIMVRQEDPDFICLIDFGLASPYWDIARNKHRISTSRRDDMKGLVYVVRMTHAILPDWFSEFWSAVEGTGHTDRPDYETWISFFQAKARDFSA